MGGAGVYDTPNKNKTSSWSWKTEERRQISIVRGFFLKYETWGEHNNKYIKCEMKCDTTASSQFYRPVNHNNGMMFFKIIYTVLNSVGIFFLLTF